MPPIIPILLCGGAGTRLWPVSRNARPKPFMVLPDGETLLQKAYQRALAVNSRTLVVTNRQYQFACIADLTSKLTKKSADTANTTTQETGYLLEPSGRNTAPAIVLAAHYVNQYAGPEALLLVLPADHLITDTLAFSQALQVAQKAAQEDFLVTFGIKPTYAETGFGYLEQGELLSNQAYRVARFVEKPDKTAAEMLLSKKNNLWNAGMFCFKAANLLREVGQVTSWGQAALRCWEDSQASAEGDPAWPKITLSPSFSTLPNISIDYAVMERSSYVGVVPCDIGWSDIGSWTTLAQLQSEDAEGNRASRDTIFINSGGNYIQSNRVVGAIGVQDLVVVDTPDALLIAHRDQVQEVKQVVEQLKQKGDATAETHNTVHRPWGSYTVLEEGLGFKVKRIEVKPGQSLSLQLHHHRAEHWIVVQGMAKVFNNGEEFLLRRNESTYIRAGHQHRLENPGTIDLVMIEVQSGEYLGEDDIVRFEDRYGRT